MTVDSVKWIYALPAAIIAAAILLRGIKIAGVIALGRKKERPPLCATPVKRAVRDTSVFFEKRVAAILHTFLVISFLLMAADLVLHAPAILFAGQAEESPLGVFRTVNAFFAGAAILSAGIFLYRRYLLQLPRFATLSQRQRTDAAVILLLEIVSAATCLLAYFIYPPALALHYLIMLAFGWYLTYSKHLHIFLAPLYLAVCGRRTPFHPPELPEAATGLDMLLGLLPDGAPPPGRMGVRDASDLPRWELLSAFACTECGRCDQVCPPVSIGENFSPRQIVASVRRAALLGKDRPLYGPVITPAEAFSCISCGACLSACPIAIDPLSLLLGLRRYGALEAGDLPPETARAAAETLSCGNPWGILIPASDGFPVFSKERPAEYLLWRGPMGIFDPQGRENVKTLARLLDAAGVSWAALPEKEESDTADILRYAGEEMAFLASARRNIAALNAREVKKIITPCPHSYTALKNYYPALGGHYEVSHSTELLEKLIGQGSLKPTGILQGKKVAYHDPCRLSRAGHTDAPRRIIRALGGQLVEPPHNAAHSMCCGGGDYFQAGEKIHRIAALRREELLSTGADVLITACPYCLRMLEAPGQGTPPTTDILHWLKV